MLVCNKCSGTKIKLRTNSSHGKKSRSITSGTCKNCGSTDLTKQVVRSYRKSK